VRAAREEGEVGGDGEFRESHGWEYIHVLFSFGSPGNDIGAFAQGLPVANSIASYSSALSRLVGAGVSEFLLFEVPNVGFTPLVRNPASPLDPDAASRAAAALNSVFFDLVVAGLPDTIGVTRINTFDLTMTAFENPSFFGAAVRPVRTLSARLRISGA
jgi:phospholipase/lecithinase/hemolysin